MALATLSIDLVAKLASLEQGLDKAGRLAEKNAARIDSAFSGLRVAAAGLGGVIAGAFSVGSIETFFRATVDGLDKLNDLKDATGASIENISALEDVALRTGSSFETVSTALVKLNKVLGDSKPGSDAANALQALGLNAEKLKQIDPAEAMLEVAKALEGFADDGNKARVVQELFGKSIQEVAPLLKDLAEKGKLVATVTTEQAQAAEDFNKQLSALSKNLTDVARTTAGPLVESMNKVAESFKESEKAGESFFTKVRKAQLAVLGNPFGLGLPGNTGGASGSFGDPVKPSLAGESEKQKALKKFFEDNATASEKFRAELAKQKAALGDLYTPEVERRLREKFFPPKKKAEEKLIDGLPMDRVEAFRQSELAATAKVNEAIAAAELAEFEKQREATQKALAKDQEHFNDLLSATPTAKLEQARADMQLLAKALEDGTISAEQFSEAAQARLGTLPENFKKVTDEMAVFAEQAGRNIQDALGDTIFDTISGKFDDIGSRWKTLLQRMASEAMAAQIGKALFGDFGKKSWGLAGDLFGGLFGLLGGAPGSAAAITGGSGLKIPASALKIPSFDVGTPFVPQDTLALVHKGERIIPAAQNRPGARNSGRTVSVAYNPTIYVDSRTDQAQVAKIAADINAEGQRHLIDSLRAQGVLH